MQLCPYNTFNELVPDGFTSVNSDERMCQVMLVGHVAVMTQVTVVTLNALPANTTNVPLATLDTPDEPVTHT